MAGVSSKAVHMSSLLSCLLYTSEMTPDLDTRQIGHIVKQARELNAIHGITGMLVFDGERFAQYVEGPPEVISLLGVKLAMDIRHRNFRPLLNQALAGERRFANWAMGYSDADMGAFDIPALNGMSADLALERFYAGAAASDSL